MTHAFQYKNDTLYCEDIPLEDIAREFGTPVYCYSTAQIEANYRAYTDAFDRVLPDADVTICYACKANSNIAVLKTLKNLGAGADIVSGGELRRALAADISPDKIVYSGVGKSIDEIELALERGLMQINVESVEELEFIADTAKGLQKTARIALRVNPDQDAGTHRKITTGTKEDKFGIDIDQAASVCARIADMPEIELAGISVHIGSQLLNLDPFRAAYKRIADLVRTLRADGHDIRRVDIGGGIGIVYHDGDAAPDMDEYAKIVRDEIAPLDVSIVLEPGRSIVGDAGVLLSRILYIKEGSAKKFVILDAAMNDLIRPTLYDAYHPVWPCTRHAIQRDPVTYDIVGPVCETGDTFAVNEKLQELAPGNLVALMCSGAYGAVMASAYNTRPIAAEVLVNGDKAALIKKQQTVEDMLQWEIEPDWLQTA